MTHLIENITKLLEHTGFTPGEVEVTHDEQAGILWFSITSPNTRILLARDAEVLSALNHIATKVTEKHVHDLPNRLRVVIDVNGIEKKKIENLRTVAYMMAERARYFKSSIDLEPMTAYDRRIVHEFLAEMIDIQTESKGDGKDRHIVISYKPQ